MTYFIGCGNQIENENRPRKDAFRKFLSGGRAKISKAQQCKQVLQHTLLRNKIYVNNYQQRKAREMQDFDINDEFIKVEDDR